jgi:hypothetical protein
MNETTKQSSSNPLASGASAVVAEAFAAMRGDDRARLVVEALEHAWDGSELNADRATQEIETATTDKKVSSP